MRQKARCRNCGTASHTNLRQVREIDVDVVFSDLSEKMKSSKSAIKLGRCIVAAERKHLDCLSLTQLLVKL